MFRFVYRDTGGYAGHFFLGMIIGGALVLALPELLPHTRQLIWAAVVVAVPAISMFLRAVILEMRDILRRARERREQMWDDCWDPWEVAWDITRGSRRRRRGTPRVTLGAATLALLRRPLF